MTRRLQHLIFVMFLIGLWFLLTAASAASESSALAICGVAGALLSFVLKLVPAGGYWILGITIAASIGITLGAELYTRELVITDLQHANSAILFSDFMAAWGLAQLVYATLKQSPKTAGAVT